MPVPSPKPLRSDPVRTLLIAQNPEASYRFARSKSDEVNVVLASPAGEIEVDDGPYDRVIVAAFPDQPDLLRKLVDASFDLVKAEGQVFIGASDAPEAGAIEQWETAFVGIETAGWDDDALPAVRVRRSDQAVAGSGASLHGVLTALGAPQWQPGRATILSEATEDDTKATAEAPVAPAAPGARSLRQTLRERRKLLVIAAVAALVVIAVSLALVAWLNEYFLAVLGLGIAGLLALHVIRSEQQSRRILAVTSSQRDQLKALRSNLKPERINESLSDQAKELVALRKAVTLTELAAVDNAKAIERLGGKARDLSESS